MKRWVVATDETLPVASFGGQFPATGVPDVGGYEVGEWVEAVVSEADPRVVWRLRCVELDD